MFKRDKKGVCVMLIDIPAVSSMTPLWVRFPKMFTHGRVYLGWGLPETQAILSRKGIHIYKKQHG